MNINSLLHTNKEAVRRAVLETLGKSEDDIQKDKQLIKNWFRYQKHLPEIDCENILEAFLVVNKFNLEKCKRKLEKYYTIRAEIPELYLDKNPKLDHMKTIANTVYAIPLPQLTPSLSRITVIKLKDFDPGKFNTLNYFAHTYNIVEIRIREDMMLSDTLIYDMEGIQWGHLFKLRFGHMKKAVTVLEKVFSTRLEGIHYINMPSSMQIFVSLVKGMLREKMRKRIHVHKDLGSLYQHLPKELLPEDYGGYEMSLNELHALWMEKFKESQKLFDYLETLVSNYDESASVHGDNEDEEDTIPIHCDFKHLSVD